jgi:protein TonB
MTEPNQKLVKGLEGRVAETRQECILSFADNDCTQSTSIGASKDTDLRQTDFCSAAGKTAEERRAGKARMPILDTRGPDAVGADSHGPEDLRLEALLGKALEEKPVWAGLYESIRDLAFPPKLPPLELTSTPIPVPDRLASTTSPWAVGTATVVNGAILAILLCMGVGAAFKHPLAPVPGASIDLSDMHFFAPVKLQSAGGGGGGGAHDLIDPIRGRLPKFENTPLLPPQVPLLEQPRLAIDPSIAVQQDIKLPDNPTLPNIGVHQSPNVTLASNGPGSEAGMGTGLNGGLGPGKGIGLGPGDLRGFGGQVYTPGGAVSDPVPLLTPEAEFSDEARRQKFEGVCMIAVIIDSHGNPQNPRVIRPLGMGLDQKALDAVLRYRFKPAMKDGKPVPVMITVAVNFRLF